MNLVLNGTDTARGNAPGTIPKQPQDGLTIGRDTETAVGDYAIPHALAGEVTNISITPK